MSASPPVATIVRCSASIAASGRSAYSSRSPRSSRTSRVDQLGSPVVTALRVRSRYATMRSTRAALTGPVHALATRQSPPSASSRPSPWPWLLTILEPTLATWGNATRFLRLGQQPDHLLEKLPDAFEAPA